MATTKKEAAKNDTTALSIRLPADLQAKAKEKSKRTGVPVSFVVRRALEEWVKTKDTFVLYDPEADAGGEDGNPFAPQ